MADYKLVTNKLLNIEGGYQDDPDDTGNFYKGENLGTNRGITPGTYAKYLGRDVTKSEMIDLDLQTTIAIYKVEYWDRIQADFINSQAVAENFFDATVQAKYASTKMMQRVLNEHGENLTVDGIIGPLTTSAINRQNEGVLHNEYRRAREEYLRKVALNPKKAKYLRGWLNRLEKFPYLEEGPQPTQNPISSTVNNVMTSVDYVSSSLNDVLVNITPRLGNGENNKLVVKMLLMTGLFVGGLGLVAYLWRK